MTIKTTLVSTESSSVPNWWETNFTSPIITNPIKKESKYTYNVVITSNPQRVYYGWSNDKTDIIPGMPSTKISRSDGASVFTRGKDNPLVKLFLEASNSADHSILDTLFNLMLLCKEQLAFYDSTSTGTVDYSDYHRHP